ncbi:MAG TPA: amidoligase family protein [Methanosarcina sp.]|nr:amidoligase family protein [Methanosarcina sp.]
MRAIDFITELNMSPGRLQQFAAGPIAAQMQAGFEAELIIPGDYIGDDDEEPDYDQDSTLPRNVDLSDIADFFNANRWRNQGMSDLESNYQDWYNDKQSDWIDDNLSDRIEELKSQDEDLDDSDAEEQAREQLEEEFNSDPDSHDASLLDYFHDENLHTYLDIYQEYNTWFDWPYTRSANSDFETEVEGYARSLHSVVNQNVIISSEYHGDAKRPDTWYFEPDVSIDPDADGYMGAELVSPPMPVPQMLTQLKRVLRWAKDNGAKTNDSTGLHVGVSLGENTQNVDYVKLALFLGDQYVLQQFGRQANSYTKSSARMIHDVAQRTVTSSQYSAILDNMRQGLIQAASQSLLTRNANRYVSINMREGYIEFRSMGGDYIDNIDQIVNTVMRFVQAYAVAADPNAERKEYAKKLAKLINPSNNDYLSPFVQYAGGQLNKKDLVTWLSNRIGARTVKKSEKTYNDYRQWINDVKRFTQGYGIQAELKKEIQNGQTVVVCQTDQIYAIWYEHDDHGKITAVK